MTKKKLICVVGATASGKTGLGVALAKKFDGEIVSADSRQVFRLLDIGTGKDLDEYGDVPYHLIDICVPGESFTLFDWLAQARKVIDDIWARGKVPIVVGGTGLYVQALIEGFEIKPTKELKNRRTEEQYSREDLESKSKEELAEILIDLDEEAFLNIDVNNPARSIRAIEKAQSGEKVAKEKPDFDFILIGKDLPREELYSKIDRRVEEWFGEGFYEEVKGLIESGVSLEWLNKIGLEYRILAEYLTQKSKPKTQKIQSHCEEQTAKQSEMEGSLIYKEISPTVRQSSQGRNDNVFEFEEMKQRMKYSIHQYARRQLIWWRRFEVEWVRDSKLAIDIADHFLKS